MEELDYTICPKCKSDENTYVASDEIWERGRIIRHCDGNDCNTYYEVKFIELATKSIKVLEI